MFAAQPEAVRGSLVRRPHVLPVKPTLRRHHDVLSVPVPEIQHVKFVQKKNSNNYMTFFLSMKFKTGVDTENLLELQPRNIKAMAMQILLSIFIVDMVCWT